MTNHLIFLDYAVLILVVMDDSLEMPLPEKNLIGVSQRLTKFLAKTYSTLFHPSGILLTKNEL